MQIFKSAARNVWFSRTLLPRVVVPTSFTLSNTSWFSHAYRLAMSGPSFLPTSSCVMARCVPNEPMKRMFSSLIPALASSATNQGVTA